MTHSHLPSFLARRGLLLALLVLILDQFSKWYMLEVVHIAPRTPIHITPFFDLVMVWNRGISFGMLAHGSVVGVLLLILMALGITAWLVEWLSRTDSRLVAIGIGLAVGGALGNVVDRVRFGAVADFFYFHYQDYYWPAFNIADSAICIGVALLCIESMLPQGKKGP